MKKLVYVSLLSVASLFAITQVDARDIFNPGPWEKEDKASDSSNHDNEVNERAGDDSKTGEPSSQDPESQE